MASVFKREGAGKSNRWYAQIKIGKKWKVIRLPAVYKGENAIREDRALHLTIEAELLATARRVRAELVVTFAESRFLLTVEADPNATSPGFAWKILGRAESAPVRCVENLVAFTCV